MLVARDAVGHSLELGRILVADRQVVMQNHEIFGVELRSEPALRRAKRDCTHFERSRGEASEPKKMRIMLV